jgi:hypothetical protein
MSLVALLGEAPFGVLKRPAPFTSSHGYRRARPGDLTIPPGPSGRFG